MCLDPGFAPRGPLGTPVSLSVEWIPSSAGLGVFTPDRLSWQQTPRAACSRSGSRDSGTHRTARGVGILSPASSSSLRTLTGRHTSPVTPRWGCQACTPAWSSVLGLERLPCGMGRGRAGLAAGGRGLRAPRQAQPRPGSCVGGPDPGEGGVLRSHDKAASKRMGMPR